MADENDQFEGLLEEFASELDLRSRSLEAQMDEVKRMLESETDGLRCASNVRHMPISARLKDKEKALRTLRRRQEDRKRLRELKEYVEGREPGSWEQYCKEWSMEDKIDEAKPFTTLKEMFNAMHDLAGIRISIYFPNDVQKVVKFLEQRFDIVEPPSRKGGLTRDFQKIRNLVERQRRLRNAAEDDGKAMAAMEMASSAPESTFDGYRATHVVIRHRRDKLDFDKHVRGENIGNIEVQIGSIIMHAWSDIEHDILYKPSDVGETSPDVVRMLDLINGIVMTGEVALQQLASVADAEAKRQAENREQKAHNWQYMVPWLDKYCIDRKIALPRNHQWHWVLCLFDILKSTGEHTYGRVEGLLDEMRLQHRVFQEPLERLPAMILHHLGRDTYPFMDRGFEPPNFATTWNARYWATLLVNTLNLAIYMNTCNHLYWQVRGQWEGGGDKSAYVERPTFAEFLDILHPTKPWRRVERHDKMIEFCKHLLATKFTPEVEWYALMAMKLASAGYIARPRLSDEEEKALSRSNEPPAISVPSLLSYFTSDNYVWFQIILSAVEEDPRVDGHHFFIPRRTNYGDRAWKPVRREKKEWIITRAEFVSDVSLVFENDMLPRKYVDHMSRVLDIKIDPEIKYDEVNNLYTLAKELNIENKADELCSLLRNARAIGTTDADVYRQFLELRDKLDLKRADELREVAELASIMNTMDAEELKGYRELVHTHGTKDPGELRKLRKPAGDNGTKDQVQLRKSQERKRAEEAAPIQGEGGEGDDPTEGGSCHHGESQYITQLRSQGGVGERQQQQDQQTWEQTRPTTREFAGQSQRTQEYEQDYGQQGQGQRQQQFYNRDYGNDADDETQVSQRPVLKQQQRVWGQHNVDTSGEHLDERQYSVPEDADQTWRDNGDRYRMGDPGSVGYGQGYQYNDVDQGGHPESKREKLFKGFGALKASWGNKR